MTRSGPGGALVPTHHHQESATPQVGGVPGSPDPPGAGNPTEADDDQRPPSPAPEPREADIRRDWQEGPPGRDAGAGRSVVVRDPGAIVKLVSL
ncbi:hypothetical protein Franean1_3627 [Parafrankia sp. EAN1pec]|nr:hypothetical protein Franean1_3627 [Frankia sp. EAN1pec]